MATSSNMPPTRQSHEVNGFKGLDRQFLNTHTNRKS